MAEVFGVVSGAVGTAGAAMQFADGIRKLHRFYKDVQNAPKGLQHATDELQLLSNVLDGIAVRIQQKPVALAYHAGLPAVY